MESFVDAISKALRGEPTLEQGRKLYENLWRGGVPDAFAVLARRVYPHKRTGDMRSAGYHEDMADFHGNIGGSHASIVAAEWLHKYFRDATLITTSFVGHMHRSPPAPDEPHAEVAAAELVEAGVPESQIEKLPDSFSTFSELLEVIKSSMDENKGRKHVAVLVNGTQVKRAQAILDTIDRIGDPQGYRDTEGMSEALATYLKKRDSGEFRISIVSSEDVLERTDRHYARLVRQAKDSDIWKRTEERDNAVAEQIYSTPELYGTKEFFDLLKG